jgi:hypothetical protein
MLFNVEGRSRAPNIDFTHFIKFDSGSNDKLNDLYVELVFESRKAMKKMPKDKRGIVIGSGDNTEKWHKKGWETLDFNPIHKTNYIGDANYLSELIGEEDHYNFLFSENVPITMSECSMPVDGIRLENILSQTSGVLKKNGVLIIKTIDFGERKDIDMAPAEKYMPLMEKNGFNAVLEINDLSRFANPCFRTDGVSITWYARKIK